MRKSLAFVRAFVWPEDLTNVLVVIPAFNEAKCIAGVVQNAIDNGFTNVLVVNDGSGDGTADAARAAGAQVLTLPFNLGIGGAVQAGFRFAAQNDYDYVIRLDGDGQHHAEDAAKLLLIVRQGQADVVIGSRFLPGQHTYKAPLSREIGIRWFALLISMLTHKPAYDTTSGMQALNRHAFSLLAFNYPQDYPEVEARVLLYKAKMRILEVPVAMHPRVAGLSSITLIKAIYYVIKVSLSTLMADVQESPPKLAGEY